VAETPESGAPRVPALAVVFAAALLIFVLLSG
jgi:hypothetical protein